jgi:hypothetical protein
MGFKLAKLTNNDVVAGERLYLTTDRQSVVSEGDRRAATLLAAIGQVVPKKFVGLLGDIEEPAKSETSPEPSERRTRVVRPQTRG